MKPAFALSFSATGISVHHLSDGDWFCIGEVALDAPDLNTQLLALQEKAFALETNLNCKVVIPTDQVRFHSAKTDIETAKQALAETTPYAVEDLIFATTTDGPTAYVAAVTRQTLDEATDFATAHGFIPVHFTTETDQDQFPVEPVFGMDEVGATEGAPPSQDVADTTTENVHAIADDTAPDVFRSAPTGGAAAANTDARIKQFIAPAAVAVAVVLAIGAWALIPSGSDEATAVETTETQATPTEPEILAEPEAVEPETSTAAAKPEPEALQTETIEQVDNATPDENPALSPTDAAILEALNIAPTPVEEIARGPDPQDIPAQPGIEIKTPDVLVQPDVPQEDEPYLASVDNTNLSTDAVALPPVTSYETDSPLEQVALPSVAGNRFELDDRGLVTPSTEGTLNPDGVIVYLGRPSKVPPEPPVRFEEEPTPDETTDRLAELRPKPRPDDLIERFERQQLGGRTREELAVLRPKLRPASVQQQPEIDYTPTALAVVRVPRPKPRPAGLAASSTQTASLGSTAGLGQVDAGSFQPKAVAPKIPSTASVARQATIDNALNLRKVNLIGVYGTPANRRALVRLPSGRLKKLKVGDRLDGGKVVAIGDSELRYQKKGRNVTLKMPRS